MRSCQACGFRCMMYMYRTEVRISSEITTKPVDASKFIARSKLNAGRLATWNIFLENRTPNKTAMRMTSEVKQNAVHPSPANRWEEMTIKKRKGTVESKKM